MIGVGDRRGVAAVAGVNAGRGDVAVGRGVAGVVAAGVVVAVAAAGATVGDASVVTGALPPGTISPVSRMRATLSLLMSTSTLPFGGAGGAASCLPLTVICTLSANPR